MYIGQPGFGLETIISSTVTSRVLLMRSGVVMTLLNARVSVAVSVLCFKTGLVI